MNRRATPQSIAAAVRLLRGVRPDAFIAADIIVGFPGETQEDFEATRKLVLELNLSKLHVFPFSPRPGTRAFGMRGRVASSEVKRRSHILLELSKELLEDFLKSWQEKEVSVILEQKHAAAGWQGTSAYSIKCKIEGATGVLLKPGMLVKARITDINRDMLCGARFIAPG